MLPYSVISVKSNGVNSRRGTGVFFPLSTDGSQKCHPRLTSLLKQESLIKFRLTKEDLFMVSQLGLRTSFSRKVCPSPFQVCIRAYDIDTTDMPTCHNSPIYRDEPAGLVDAAPIITLRAAGALIFGKTTTTEFASTTVGGSSANPHDPSRTPGGSSSASGAAVADY